VSSARIRLAARSRAWLFALLGIACSRAQEGQASGGASAVPDASPPLASETAFDLAASPSGALLTWIESGTTTVSLARFDAEGVRIGERSRRDIALGPGAVAFDLSLSDSSAGPVSLWLERDGTGIRGRAAWLEQLGPAIELGSGWGTSAARGNVAVAARGQGALAVVRGEPKPCVDGSAGSCSELRFYTLEPGGGMAAGLTLAVPDACGVRAIQLVSGPGGGGEPGRWDYAVCSTSPQRSIVTVFSIHPERQYALAERAFDGCTPLGAARFAGAASFFALCDGDRRMASAGEPDSPLHLQAVHERGLVCSRNAARLRFGSGWLRLTEPMGGLELVLDVDLAPAGARAVWTGAALLVARVEAAALRIAKYVCSGSELRELANPLTAG
jgi:hypothetical protein